MLEFDLQLIEKKLAKANAIIKKIAENNQYITPIVPADYKLFRTFFNKAARHTYGNSWIYVTQSAFGIGPEKLGYKYYDGKNLCALSIYPKIEQPDVMMFYWIRPLGNAILPIIIDLAEKIKQEHGVYTYVKKLFPKQSDFLLKNGFISAEGFPWHSSTHSEDDTYPELIYDREQTRQAILAATKRSCLGGIARGVAKLQRDNKIAVTTINFQNQAWDIVKTYFSEYSSFSNKPNVSSPIDYYNMIFGEQPIGDDIDKRIVLVNEKPAGFYILTRNKKIDTTIPYGCIMLRQFYKYLADYWLLMLFDTEETKYINLGGSEDAGIHGFKNKYMPAKKNHMCWVTNYQLSQVEIAKQTDG